MKFRDAITSRIKIMAKLDIAEKRLPQDGRIKIRFNDNGTQQGDRLPRLVPADAVRREDRHASPRQGQADARHDAARLRARVAGALRARRSPSRGAWCSSPARPAAARPTRSIRRSRKLNTMETNIMTAEDPVEFNLPGVNQVNVKDSDRPELRGRPALLPAPGSEHHPRRRNPRLRDRGNRGQGRAHRPPRAVDAAHQRRAEHDQPPDEHGHRAVPGGELGEPDLRAAPGAPPVHSCARKQHPLPPQGFIDVGIPAEDAETATAVPSRSAARSATTPATRAASASTR